MNPLEAVSDTEELFERARHGDRLAFGEWAGRMEQPLRSSLWRFARMVDLEVVVQESLLRASTDSASATEDAWA